jgi:hypothetical protein
VEGDMRVIVALLVLVALVALAAFATRPGRAEFDAMVKQGIERKIATADVGKEGGDTLAQIALIGCKMRPTECMQAILGALDVTVEQHALYTRYAVKSLRRETSCTGAFTRVWCGGDVTGE